MALPEDSDSDEYELEETESAHKDSAHSSHGTESCQNCGAPRPEKETMVCISCGYDMKKNKVLGTRTGIVDAPQEEDQSPVVAGKGVHIWLIAGGICGLILIAALLMGWHSLFDRSDGLFLSAAGEYTLESPRYVTRFLGIIRLLVGGLTLVLMGGLAVKFTAMVHHRPAGDWAPIFARLSLVVAISGLALLIPLSPMWLEWVVQMLIGCGLALGGSFMLIRLKGPQLRLFCMAWVLMTGLLLPAARLIAWSFGI